MVTRVGRQCHVWARTSQSYNEQCTGISTPGFKQFFLVTRCQCAVGGTLEEQFAFARVSRERCRALELRARLVEAAELGEEVAAHARQQVVSL